MRTTLTAAEAARGFKEAAEYIEKNGLVRETYFDHPILTGDIKVPEEDCAACAIGAFCKVMGYPGGDYTWDELDKLMVTLEEYPVYMGKKFVNSRDIADFSDNNELDDVVGLLNYLADVVTEKSG